MNYFIVTLTYGAKDTDTITMRAATAAAAKVEVFTKLASRGEQKPSKLAARQVTEDEAEDARDEGRDWL